MEDKELYSVQIIIEPSNIGYNIRASSKEEAEEIATEYFYRDCGAYFNDLNHHIETFKFILKEGGYKLCKV